MTEPFTHRIVDDKVTIFEHSSGLTAVASVCSTVLGSALAPLGIQPVTLDQAIDIAVKKGNALASKCALHDIDHGGGCVLIIGDPSQPKPAVFHELAAHICDHYKGQIIVGQDVGTTDDDIARVAALVANPATVAHHPDGANHALTTARGVRLGIQAAFNYACADKRLEEARILVQGLGSVGKPLVQELRDNVTRQVIYTNRGAVAGFDSEGFVDPDHTYDVSVDVLSPCISPAGAITKDVVDRLDVKIIAGSSNLQFADEKAIWAAHRKGILHAPDPIINGGGIIAVTQHTEEKVRARLDLIPKKLIEIFERSKATDTPPLIVAQQIAREIIEAAARAPKI